MAVGEISDRMSEVNFYNRSMCRIMTSSGGIIQTNAIYSILHTVLLLQKTLLQSSGVKSKLKRPQSRGNLDFQDIFQMCRSTAEHTFTMTCVPHTCLSPVTSGKDPSDFTGATNTVLPVGGFLDYFTAGPSPRDLSSSFTKSALEEAFPDGRDSKDHPGTALTPTFHPENLSNTEGIFKNKRKKQPPPRTAQHRPHDREGVRTPEDPEVQELKDPPQSLEPISTEEHPFISKAGALIQRLKILPNDSGIGLRKAAAVILIHTQLVQTWTSTPDRERSEPCLTLRVEYQHGLRTAALERALLCQRKLSLLNSNPTGNRASLNRHGDLAYGGAARSSESSQYGSARKPRKSEWAYQDAHIHLRIQPAESSDPSMPSLPKSQKMVLMLVPWRQTVIPSLRTSSKGLT
ncbi:hypothetical protein MJG53_016017 [Ovis ammon polii x Ovis aries]|uniref:Uncharacterized protein n=1 Tax=Ovis ammon polii x Ovis aries TaxID=2918886 RepID=A0ACB9UD21_9CETA|nr:hypothetical protein MJG53_016017 [Ovis ammon polii x Ovis aries]